MPKISLSFMPCPPLATLRFPGPVMPLTYGEVFMWEDGHLTICSTSLKKWIALPRKNETKTTLHNLRRIANSFSSISCCLKRSLAPFEQHINEIYRRVLQMMRGITNIFVQENDETIEQVYSGRLV